MAQTSPDAIAGPGDSALPREHLPTNPRILFVTPEISHVSSRMCPGAEYIRAKAGGMADVSASLVERLLDHHADIHLAIPHYRNLFKGNRVDASALLSFLTEDSRVHLAEDNAFYHNIRAYHGDPDQLRHAALAFQREVINEIIPRVQPDIVHCNDWMTGLIPAACKRMGIKSVFTIHNVHRERTTLAEASHRGINASLFWDLLYYDQNPHSFEQSYHHNPIDFLSSGIINADYVTTVSPTFLQEIIHGHHGELPDTVRWDLHAKIEAGYAKGILNAPPLEFAPSEDHTIARPYTAESHHEGKARNKAALQKKLGLKVDPEAPLFFWPSRLDPIQKGCQLLTDILYEIMHAHEKDCLQLAVIGDGPFQCHFHDIVARHQLNDRVAVIDFDESLSRLAFAGSDFVLMPSSFEPCGLPQMIGARYGTIPLAHNTGGLRDTVKMFTDDYAHGNGILFDIFDSNGLRWAMERAIDFHHAPANIRRSTIARVMREADHRFSEKDMFEEYLVAYAKLADDRATQAHRRAIHA